jgi:PAP2 superfamily
MIVCFRNFLRCVFVLSVCVIAACPSYAFQASGPLDSEAATSADAALPDAPPPSEDVTLKGLPLAILKDQIPIWTSPIRTRPHDLIWLLPLGAATGITLSTDTDTMREVSHDPGYNKNNVNVSNYVLGGELAIPAVMYGLSLLNGNDHAHETGILSGEALADAVIVEEIAKVAFRRERPLYNNAAGDFFVSGLGSKGGFPSSHSTLAWAAAAVIANEYPSIRVNVLIYTTATAVSLTRVLGQEHFPTDVLVGGAAGWLIGHYVVKKHSQYRTAYGLHAILARVAH